MSYRFYGAITNGRGRKITAASPETTHIHGRKSGVRVTPRASGKRDIFDIYATSGQEGSFSDVLLGTFEYIEGTGPVFTPVGAGRVPVIATGTADYLSEDAAATRD